MRIIAGRRGLGRKRRRRQFAPPGAAVAAPQLGAEMAEIECRIERLAIAQHRRHRIAEKMRLDDIPMGALGRQLEQALAGPDIEPLWHRFPYPPVNAWKTWISSFSPTASPSRRRSRSNSPLR